MLGIKQEPEAAKGKENWIGPAPWIQTPLPGPIAKAMVERDHAVGSP